jgi:hypothetical protein
MNLLLWCALIVFLAWAYIFFGRPFLRDRYPKLWSYIDPVEAWLVDRSRTLIVARLYWIGGIVIAIHDTLASYGMDWTPLVNEITNLIPADYRPLALAGFLALTGVAFDWLRHVTRESLADKKD